MSTRCKCSLQDAFSYSASDFSLTAPFYTALTCFVPLFSGGRGSALVTFGQPSGRHSRQVFDLMYGTTGVSGMLKYTGNTSADIVDANGCAAVSACATRWSNSFVEDCTTAWYPGHRSSSVTLWFSSLRGQAALRSIHSHAKQFQTLSIIFIRMNV